jgi:hypothetical protein
LQASISNRLRGQKYFFRRREQPGLKGVSTRF